jgi:hypothetical protein
MSTADEIKLMAQRSWRLANGAINRLEVTINWPLLQEYQLRAFGRPVHAARARVLRRRGNEVMRTGSTSTGKAVYHWLGPAGRRPPRIVFEPARLPGRRVQD